VEGQDFFLNTQVNLLGWTLIDASGRELRRGGAVAESGRVDLGPGTLEAGWYALRLIGTENQYWTINLIRQ
jgi:hypothetical protein